jgi:putative membrane protein
VQIVTGILGLFLATLIISDVKVEGGVKNLLLCGFLVGLLNYFVKPILKKITWPLRLLTLNLLSFVINMGLIWAVDIVFKELIIKGLFSLFWATLIIWGLGLVLSLLIPKKKLG